MAARNLSKSLQQIFGHEGGYSAIRDDPGNWTGGRVGVGELKGTKFGIAAHSYPLLNIKNLTLKDAEGIYRRDYAARINFDSLPSGLDHCVLDFAINSGPSRAAKFLQNIVGVRADGLIGPATLAAIESKSLTSIINDLCDARLHFLKGLATWPKFGKGWTRRVADVRKFSLELAGAVAIPSPPEEQGIVALLGKLVRAIINLFRRK